MFQSFENDKYFKSNRYLLALKLISFPLWIYYIHPNEFITFAY